MKFAKNKHKVISTAKNLRKKTVKKTRAKKAQYSEETLVEALNNIDQGMSYRTAESIYGIPRSTLSNKFLSHTSINAKKGPKTVLTPAEERKISDWLVYAGTRGFPITKSQLLDCIQRFIRDSKRESSFKNCRPGKHWYNAFLRRHPEVSARIAQNLTVTRASVTKESLQKWFDSVEEHFKNEGLSDIGPNRIFN